MKRETLDFKDILPHIQNGEHFYLYIVAEGETKLEFNSSKLILNSDTTLELTQEFPLQRNLPSMTARTNKDLQAYHLSDKELERLSTLKSLDREYNNATCHYCTELTETSCYRMLIPIYYCEDTGLVNVIFYSRGHASFSLCITLAMPLKLYRQFTDLQVTLYNQDLSHINTITQSQSKLFYESVSLFSGELPYVYANLEVDNKGNLIHLGFPNIQTDIIVFDVRQLKRVTTHLEALLIETSPKYGIITGCENLTPQDIHHLIETCSVYLYVRAYLDCRAIPTEKLVEKLSYLQLLGDRELIESKGSRYIVPKGDVDCIIIVTNRQFFYHNDTLLSKNYKYVISIPDNLSELDDLLTATVNVYKLRGIHETRYSITTQESILIK